MKGAHDTDRSGHSRVFVLLLSGVLLVSVAVLLAQTLKTPEPTPGLDENAYRDYRLNKVSTLDELVADFELQQSRWMPVAPPATNSFGWTQRSTPDPMLFRPSGFPGEFVDGLVPFYRDGVVVYPALTTRS